jgi:predicted nucleotidyltransferase
MQYNASGMSEGLSLSTPQIADFCRRWRIRELALFGSALRGRLRPESDLDLLVTFAPDVIWSLLDHVRMQAELSDLLGRPVDLVSRRAIDRSPNPIRRREILSTARTVYAAR